MSRREDLNEFYRILDELQQRVGGCRRLQECTGKSGWPERGVYFFFEDGEFREDQKTLRVVRVGTHAITATSRTTLFNRLYTHRGHSDLGGNHRGSIFRKRIGEALWKVKPQPITSPRLGVFAAVLPVPSDWLRLRWNARSAPISDRCPFSGSTFLTSPAGVATVRIWNSIPLRCSAISSGLPLIRPRRSGWDCNQARERFKNPACGTRTTSRNSMTRCSLENSGLTSAALLLDTRA